MAAALESHVSKSQGPDEHNESDGKATAEAGIERSCLAEGSREQRGNALGSPRVHSSSNMASKNTDDESCSSKDTTNSTTEESQHDGDDDDIEAMRIDEAKYEKRICEFILSLSLNTENSGSFDDVDGFCEHGDPDCLKTVHFLQSVPDNTRHMVAKYLSSGNPNHLAITRDNLHHTFHLAKSMCLNQLYNECMKLCMTKNSDEVIEVFDKCECAQDVMQESKTGFHRFISVVESNETSVEFYIVVSDNGADTNRNRVVKVIDMTSKKEIFQRDVHSMQQLGNGTDVCCGYKKESPYIFACGGEGKSAQLCWKYDVLLGRWSKCVKMPQARIKHRLISSDSSIFAIGGLETSEIDEYNIASNKWMSNASLIKHVQLPVCVMYSTTIYIFGGKTAAGPVATVQRYDTLTHNVTCLPNSLPCEFVDGMAIAFEDKLYIATDNGHMICFEPETGDSFLCAQQPVQRSSFGMFLKNERIYVVGGVARDDDEELVSTPMYRFNPKKNTWTAEPGPCTSFPVYSSCIVKYPKCCPVVPFDDKF